MGVAGLAKNAVIARPKAAAALRARRRRRAAPAHAVAAAPKPPVPLFYKPRVAVITDKPYELKTLRDAAATRGHRARGSTSIGTIRRTRFCLICSASSITIIPSGGSRTPTDAAVTAPSPCRHTAVGDGVLGQHRHG